MECHRNRRGCGRHVAGARASGGDRFRRARRARRLPDEAFRAIKRPVLVLSGTKDGSDAGNRYRTLLPDCHFMFVYDAGRAIAAERPEALAYIALEFLERRNLFLVSRESGMAFP